MRHYDDIVLRTKIGAGLYVVLMNKVERYLPTIECQPHPPDFFGVLPCCVNGYARQVHSDGIGLRHRREDCCNEPEVFNLLAHTSGLVTRHGNEKRSRRKLCLAGLE